MDTEVKDWIPFFQSVLWPAVIIFVVFRFRRTFIDIFSAIAKRGEQGDSFEAGTSGIKLGHAPPPSRAGTMHPELASADARSSAEHAKKDTLPHVIYLVHRARRDRTLDKNNEEFYRLRIWLDADEESFLDEVASVTYHLHPTFRHTERKVSDRASDFALATAAWGQFNVSAQVEFKDGRPLLEIERYLNF